MIDTFKKTIVELAIFERVMGDTSSSTYPTCCLSVILPFSTGVPVLVSLLTESSYLGDKQRTHPCPHGVTSDFIQ